MGAGRLAAGEEDGFRACAAEGDDVITHAHIEFAGEFFEGGAHGVAEGLAEGCGILGGAAHRIGGDCRRSGGRASGWPRRR